MDLDEIKEKIKELKEEIEDLEEELRLSPENESVIRKKIEGLKYELRILKRKKREEEDEEDDNDDDILLTSIGFAIGSSLFGSGSNEGAGFGGGDSGGGGFGGDW